MPASRVDYIDVVWKWMPYVVALVILGAFVVLAFAFRSPVVAAKAVLLNLFSVGAAFGLATLVFIDGFGSSLIGMPHASALLVAAVLLWLLDASLNVSMEPFRAFVGDMTREDQRAQGYAVQTMFIGAGAVLGSLALANLLAHRVGNGHARCEHQARYN